MLVELLFERVVVNDDGCCRLDGLEGTSVERCIYLHAARVEHGAQECIFWQVIVDEQYGDAKYLECGESYESEVASVCYSLCH